MMTETLANIHLNKQQQQYQHRKMEREKLTINTQSSSSINKPNSALSMYQTRPDRENVKRAGSFVVGQKLRESKWFTHSEIGIFCAVTESGFIIEQKINKDDEETRYGVAIWTPGYEKSKNPEYITIYTLTENKGKFKVTACTLSEFWPESTIVRINNKSDKTTQPLSEDIIRNQIIFAQNATKRKWHNGEHFVYFCRYGPPETNVRTRKITDQLLSNTGAFFLKIRSLTAK